MTSWEVLAAKCLIDPHSCGRHAEDACNRGWFFVSKRTSFDLVWKVFTSLPAGCGRHGRRGRREGVNAHEAAAQAAVVIGEGSSLVPDFLLLDVNLLSMGLETADDVLVRLIERNITCFTEKGQTFTTCVDNQSGVLIQAFKRERVTVEDNNSLEKSHLDEIPPASCGLPQDETIFDTNAYGVVSAFVLVTNVGGMFYEFVKGMHDAYKHISSHVSIVPQYAERLNSSRRVWQVGAATETRGSSLRLGNDVLRGTCVAPSFTLGTTLNTRAQNFWWNLWVPRSQTTTRWLCSLLERYTSELLEPLRYLRHFQSRRCDPHARYFDLAVLNCVR